jgi:acyl-CoA-binding protein
MKGKAKWDAWTAKKGELCRSLRAIVLLTANAGVSKEEAMKAYIELVSTLKAKYA